jgi:hypothetical protein
MERSERSRSSFRSHTADLKAAIDRLEGVEEVMPEQLLLGHFKTLFEEVKFNTVEEAKAAYVCVFGDDDFAISPNFIYEMTLNLFKSSDPFSVIAQDFASKQKVMLEEERKLYREK